ncbi:MarR family transcriptional regulator [Marinobacter salinexigens]|uniref:MarR family transcriptional regulator n=1 Tax=Marinobacter salinexigens TaxID=2919747 RepID=A0A5B0V8E9_9GAMM|nr:MarR family transcriptional regulator [Marinobacter salinexigens]KAA1170870.1 MarR family transcriptional regulator [Marinobacter salinexigens]
MENDQGFFFAVGKLHRRIAKEFGQRLTCIGMTQGLAAVMMHLELVGEGSSQSEIAQSMEVEQPTLVQLISKLEKQGIIQRKPYPGDRRKSAIYFTAKGKELLTRINSIYESTCEQLFDQIDTSQLDQTEQLLLRMWNMSR